MWSSACLLRRTRPIDIEFLAVYGGMHSSTMKEIAAPEAAAAPAAVRWPTLPFFQAIAPPLPGLGKECTLELMDRRSVSGELMRFEPGATSVDMRPNGSRIQTVKLKQIRSIRLAELISLVPDKETLAAMGTTVRQVGETKPFSIILRDGSEIAGATRGFIKDKDGLYLFLIEKESPLAIGCFIPACQLKDVQIGPLLGDTLINNEFVDSETIAAALNAQTMMRQERIGTYLTDRAIITQEELTLALTEQQKRPNARLGDVLIEAKIITPKQLKEALAIQAKQRERRLGDILIDMGAVSVRLIQMALSDKLGIPYINVKKFRLDAHIRDLLDPAFAMRHQVLPLRRTEESLVIAVENPLAIEFAQDLRFTTGLTIVPVIADPDELKARITKEYSRLEYRALDTGSTTPINGGGPSGKEPGKAELSNVEDLADQLTRETTQVAAPAKVRDADNRVSDNTLVRLVNKIIIDAHTLGASDIHIESNPGNGNTRIRFRRDGELEDYLDLAPAYRNSVISRIKIMADLDISERRHPQDGKIDFRKFGSLDIELRVAVIPTANHLEDIVLRILGGMEPHPLENLEFSTRDLTELRKMITRSYGLILVCGPTGSGKTTTLHSMLHEINQPDIKIWTAEDPIEISQPRLRQVQVQPKIDWTFAAAMRAFLRADPDVIMVGEMRDAETTKICIEASLTGHLVFSTLHTNSAAESILRLLDLGMDPFNFADALIGILSQRLARTLCSKCKRARSATEKEIADLLEEYCSDTSLDPTAVLARWQYSFGDDGRLTLYEAVGCKACRNGYKGRMGVYELLVSTPQMKHLVRSRATVPQLTEAAMAGGMRRLKHDAIEKIWSGALDLHAARTVSA